MQVKVFESQDMASGLKMVKESLGPDALILSTKTIRSGKLGLLGKSHFEITAAVDTMWPHKGGISLRDKTSDTDQDPQSERDLLLSPDVGPVQEQTGTYNASLRLNNAAPAKPHNQHNQHNNQNYSVAKNEGHDQLQTEVNELKGMIQNLGQEMLRMNGSSTFATKDNSNDHCQGDDSRLQALEQRLLGYGISTETARTISGFAKESLTLDELSDPFKQQQYVKETIHELLQVQTDLFGNNTGQHRLALVGPTGVGKTTTLAKIAAHFLSNHSAKIGFITIDTYRIAAVEQLKVYGDIMNIPVEVVINPEQLENALLNMRDKDLILIDTAGRSPQDSLCINELASFLHSGLSIQKHLVLSATTRENEVFEAIQRFSVLGLDSAIITKIDECTSLGLLLDIQIREKVPFSYITNGQRVPEDIIEADKDILTELIMFPGKGLTYE